MMIHFEETKRRWQCPGCGNVFKIPESAPDPELCEDCEASSGKDEPPPRKPVEPEDSIWNANVSESTLGRSIIAVLGVSFAVLLIAMWLDNSDSERDSFDANAQEDAMAEYERQNSEPYESKSLSTGERGVLVSSAEYVPVAVSEQAFDRFSDLVVANDEIGMQQMMLASQVLLVPTGTKVLMIDPGFFSSEIRILGGKYAGRSGFITSERAEKP